MSVLIRPRSSAALNCACLSLLIATSGCLSLPRLTDPYSASVAAVPDGPPDWDDASESTWGQEEHRVVTAPEPASSDQVSSADGQEESSLDYRALRAADRVAGVGAMPNLVSAPNEFRWKTAAVSSGDRDIQSVVIGRTGYRTMLIGSLSGNDQLAIQLSDRLAKHVHENQILLGGINLTVIRNLNPDGEQSGQSETADGIYLNRHFPKSEGVKPSDRLPSELQFLMSEIEAQQPQRVIHIRTVERKRGAIATSSGAKDVAHDVASWLNFEQVNLPGRSATGTLERYISDGGQREVVTFVMPQEVSLDDAWQLYGDVLLNLLMDDDFATRKMAREQKSSRAADLRNQEN